MKFQVDIESDNEVITFDIDGTIYHADSGMSWKQWVSSDYNTGDFQVIGSEISNQHGDTWVVDENEDEVSPNAEIIDGYSYFIYAP